MHAIQKIIICYLLVFNVSTGMEPIETLIAYKNPDICLQEGIEFENISMVQNALMRGAEITFPVFMSGIRKCNLSLARILLDYGGDPNLGIITNQGKDHSGLAKEYSCLEETFRYIQQADSKKKHIDMARLLYLYGAQKLSRSWTTTTENTFQTKMLSLILPEDHLSAVISEKEDTLEKLLNQQELSSEERQLTLAFAAGQGNWQMVNLLIKAQADPLVAFHVVTGMLRRKNLKHRSSYQGILKFIQPSAMRSLSMKLAQDPHSFFSTKLITQSTKGKIETTFSKDLSEQLANYFY